MRELRQLRRGHVAGGGTDAAEIAGRGAVRHPDWGEGVLLSTAGDRVTVLFAEHGYKTLAVDAVRERDLLQPAD